MDRADLHQRHELRIGHPPEEMHPAQVQLLRHLVEKDLLPALAAFRACAIALPVAADDQRAGIRAGAQNLRQGTHEDVVAAIGFEVAADEGDDLIAPGESRPVRQHEPCRGIRHQPRRVDPVMRHGDLPALFGRKGRGLPLGRRDRRVGLGDGLQEMRLARRDGEARHQAMRGELGIEAGIEAGGRIVELGIGQVPRLRPDLAQEQRFAPAAMTEDDIGNEAGLGAHLIRRACDDQAAPRHFGIGPGDALDGGFRRGAVAQDRHRRLPVVPLRRQRPHLVAARGQRRRKVQELAGKVLVDEENPHPASSTESWNAAAISSRV